jgi:hypothetical protein
MRLIEILLEAGVNRRQFLKQGGGTVLSTLLTQGIPLDIAKKAASGKPLFATFTLPGFDGYGDSSGWLSMGLSDAFKQVSTLYSHLEKIGASPILCSDAPDWGEAEIHYSVPLTTNVLKGFDAEWSEDKLWGTLNLPSNNMTFFVGDPSNPDDQLSPIANQTNPFIDFWNNQACFDTAGALNNAGFVKRLFANFGDKLKELQLLSGSGRYSSSLPWDKFDDFVKNPDKYFHDYSKDPWDNEVRNDGVNPDGAEQVEEPEEPNPDDGYDDYDKYLMSTMGNEGGFAMESFSKALNAILSEAVEPSHFQ